VEPPISALLEPEPQDPEITVDGAKARVRNGAVTARTLRLSRATAASPRASSPCASSARTRARSFWPRPGPTSRAPARAASRGFATDSYRLEATFRAYDGERLYGLGQPQHGHLDLKGVSTTLLQQNTHVVIPFVVSSRGYGFLWHNPAVGRAEFAKNVTRWTAEQTGQLDY
jgi:alpha-D-xyloside xylohydrolase